TGRSPVLRAVRTINRIPDGRRRPSDSWLEPFRRSTSRRRGRARPLRSGESAGAGAAPTRPRPCPWIRGPPCAEPPWPPWGGAGGGVGEAAVAALGRTWSEHAVAPLIQALLEDPGSFVREAAAHALGELWSETAVEALARALSVDPRHSVREAAAEALGKIG